MKEPVIVAAVINWNGWRDTIVCLESMLAMPGPAFELIVCDNGSNDDSHDRLKAWVREAFGSPGSPRAAVPGDCEEFVSFAWTSATAQTAHGAVRCVHVVRLRKNFGYAGAINRCIAWAREALAPDCYWLLNNDISLDPAALQHLVAGVRSAADIGMCGSVLFEWEEPLRVQAIGGVFHRAIAVGSHLKQFPADMAPDQPLFFGIDYPIGASLFVTREFVEAVGPMDEAYFLYYEEVDWAARGRLRGFRPAVAVRSKVRHKEGASTGSRGGIRSKSMLSEYYGVVNRLRFTRRFSPWLLPVVWLSLFLVASERAVHCEWSRAALVLRLMFWPGSVRRP